MQIFYAPLEGLTDAIYRRVHHATFGGVDRYYMPFLTPTHEHLITARQQRELDPQLCQQQR